MDFLAEIIALKRARIDSAKKSISLDDVKSGAAKRRAISAPHALWTALNSSHVNLIAEIKRASPSLGLIQNDVNPAERARVYESAGAAAVSVLTEEDRFLGSLDDLRFVRSAVNIPVLRKDFIFEEYQVYESASAGADALLLIVAALDDETLINLLDITENQLEMDALVEVHSGEELNRALKAGANIIGVNNRNLRTFEVSLATSVELIEDIPNSVLAVTESGLRTPEDISRLSNCGYRGFLIGETLMRSGDPAESIRNLLTLTNLTQA